MWPSGWALDPRSKGLVFDSHCWSCVEVSGKLLIPYCLCPLSSDGYLVERKFGKLWMTLAAENVLNSPQRRWDRMRESAELTGISDCKHLHLHLLHLIDLGRDLKRVFVYHWKRVRVPGYVCKACTKTSILVNINWLLSGPHGKGGYLIGTTFVCLCACAA